MQKNKEFNLVSKSGTPYRIQLPAAKKELTSGYIFALPRGGSTLFTNMLSAYCVKQSIPTVSVYDQAFSQGITTGDINLDAADALSRDGYIYTGFRHFPRFDFELPAGSPALLLVRDPRDILVSLYYSVRHSHELKNESIRRANNDALRMDISEFVLKRSRQILSVYNRYCEKLTSSSVKIYRYEDVIFNKVEWLSSIVNELSLPFDLEIIKDVVDGFDVCPESEDVSQHIRNVTPGDYRRKLEPSTIEQLNNLFGIILDQHGYTKSAL